MSNGIFKFVQMNMKRLLYGEKRIPFHLQLSPLRLHSSHTHIMKLDKRTDFFFFWGGGGGEIKHRYHMSRQMSRGMGFPAMWYVRPAKPQISLRIRAV